MSSAEPTGLAIFASSKQRSPDDPAILFEHSKISFAELDAASDVMASVLLAEGFVPGDRLAVYTQNDPAFVIATLGAWKVGGIVVPVNPMLKTDELTHILVDSGAVALMVLDDLQEVALSAVTHSSVRRVLVTTPTCSVPTAESRPLEPLPMVEVVRFAVDAPSPGPRPFTLAGSDIAYIVYTSGTTGRPKGAMLRHDAVVANAEAFRQTAGLDRTDVVMCAAPLFHVTGLVAGLALSQAIGCPMVLLHRFEPSRFGEAVERHRCTFTVMALTAYQAVIADSQTVPGKLRTLVKAFSGGSPVLPAVVSQWEALVPGSTIHNVYGLTETTSPSHIVPLGSRAPIDQESGALSVGRLLAGMEARVVEPDSEATLSVGQSGELRLRGPTVFAGYWGNREATSNAFADGFFKTGDIAKVDSEGWWFVIDRIKDIINASGYKVSPSEVEACLTSHPAVIAAAVVGERDAYRGETVKAFVVLDPRTNVTEDQLMAFCKQRLAAYKYPRLIAFVEMLPTTASGKVLRRELRSGGLK